MFAYCNNSPVLYADYSGYSLFPTTKLLRDGCGSGASGIGGASSGTAGDSIIKEIITGIVSLFSGHIILSESDQLSAYEKRKKGKGKTKGSPPPPNVEYPGDDPSKSPGEDYEWKGKGPVGGDKGSWVNRKTGEQWHPDLNHEYPKGPHWDYTDEFGYVWSVFEDGRILIW